MSLPVWWILVAAPIRRSVSTMKPPQCWLARAAPNVCAIATSPWRSQAVPSKAGLLLAHPVMLPLQKCAAIGNLRSASVTGVETVPRVILP